jgi:hypothetical protein
VTNQGLKNKSKIKFFKEKKYKYKKRNFNVTSTLNNLLGSAVVNLDGAPIKLNALVVEDCFCSQQELTSKITKHYIAQAVLEVYKVVGSIDILGNPVGLFSNLGTGVMDFFYEPANGLVQSPKAFGKGLAKVKKKINFFLVFYFYFLFLFFIVSKGFFEFGKKQCLWLV